MQKKPVALLLVLSTIIMISSISVVIAPVGAPRIGGVDSYGNLLMASNSITLAAGEETISKIDSSNVSGYGLAILFTYGNETLVTFSGAQFRLYMSKNGYSSISDDDIMYASGFSVNDLSKPYPIKISVDNPALKNGTALFQLGTADLYDPGAGANVSCRILVGPIPAGVSADYQYVKVFDGSSSLVAVSQQTVKILPSFTISPTSGHAGNTVTLNGTGLPPGSLYDLHYYSSPKSGLISRLTTDAHGFLSYSWEMADLADDYSSVSSRPITISVIDPSTNASIEDLSFTEYSRIFTLIEGDSSAINAGNNTASVNVKTQGKLHIVGSNFYPGSVAFSIDGNALGAMPVEANSTFNVTFEVPPLAHGTHSVIAVNNNVVYAFKINALPILVGSPDSGPPGTILQLKAYSFIPNATYYIYWYGLNFGDNMWHNLINHTTDSMGEFLINLTVPSAYSGSHVVAATSLYNGQNSGSVSIIASASFTTRPASALSVVFQQSGIGADATGTVLIVDGTPYGIDALPLTCSWLQDSYHSFSWQSPVSASSGKRYAWVSTSGLSSYQSGNTSVTSSGSIAGDYQIQYQLTAQASPSYGGAINPSGVNWYDEGTLVQLDATAASGYVFSQWGGDLTGSQNPSSINITSPKSITANFAPKLNTTITIAASSSSVSLGTPLTINGTIEGAIPANITISKSVNGSSFSDVTTVQAVNGVYQYSFVASGTGSHQFKASWAGNDRYNGADSPTITVAVTSAAQPFDYTNYALIIIAAAVVSAIVAYLFLRKRKKIG